MNTYKPVKTLTDVIRQFSDEDKCRQFLVQQRWNGCPECPYCGSNKYYIIENGKRFKCGNKECYKKYSVTTGSVFHASNIPLTTWFPAVYLITSHKKGISSIQLAKDLGVTQKTGWFMLHRIREFLKTNGSLLLKNTVEIDEVFIGGKMKNMQTSKRRAIREVGKNVNKTMVIGMLEREGDLRLVVSGQADSRENISVILEKNVDKSAFLMTDGTSVYMNHASDYAGHQSVNHSAQEYVRNGVIHTNGIEGAFSLFKRSIIGIYHQISPKHLFRYCRETEYRYNTRELKDGERFEISLTKIAGRLTYKDLIKKTELSELPMIRPQLPDLSVGAQGKMRAVYQIKNNKIVAKYSSLKEASIMTGIIAPNISKCVRGLRKSTKGFVFKYA
ncbi:MAG: IS1595 family transposase [Bacteroidota bacterium]|nr:IS1595 family transposase [Bacteroidota bacterium]